MTSPAAPSLRLPAIDWMRGLVMVLMAVDHADGLFSRSRHLGDDGWLFRQIANTELAPGPLLTRISTHVCAVTFLFLAGASIALSARRMGARGLGQARISGHFALRGLVLIALEITLLSAMWSHGEGFDATFLLVLFAIGGAMTALAFLRLLPPTAVVALGLALLVGAEPAIDALGGFTASPPEWQAVLLMGGVYLPAEGGPPTLIVGYPLAGWLGVMCLGYGFGHRILSGRAITPWLLTWGLLGVALAATLRYAGTIGEMGLHREGEGWMPWLRMSKYPPSVEFVAAYLGLSCVILAGLWKLQSARVWRTNPLLVLGQVPLFFYLLHLPLLWVISTRAPEAWFPRDTIATSWTAALACSALLYPACLLYRWYKQKWRHAWTRYL